VPVDNDTRAALTTGGIVALVVVFVAAVVHPFGGSPFFARALLWIAVGGAAGLVVGFGRDALSVAPLRAAWDEDSQSILHAGIGAVAGLAVSAVVGHALAAALVVVAAVVLLPELRDRVASAAGSRLAAEATTVMVLGVAAGALVGVFLPRTATAVFVVAGAVGLFAYSRRGGTGTAAGVLALSALFAPLSSQHVTVPADKAFVPAKVKVVAGQVLQVKASGTIKFLGGDSSAKADADGFPARYSGCGGPGLCGALIGRVAGGAPFLIGSNYTKPVTTAGDLELGINDYDVSDNSGSFSVSISILPAGSASAASSAATPAGVHSTSGTKHSRVPGALFVGLLAGAAAFAGRIFGARMQPAAGSVSSGAT
jgi:hypothetical protein